MIPQSPEQLARSRYFSFELAPVQAAHHGDWAAFLAWKEADEEAAAASFRPPRGGANLEPPDSPAPGRAVRALRAEYELVASARRDEVKALAQRVLDAARAGKLESLVEDCTLYDASAKERLAYTRKHFAENAAAWKKAAAIGKGALDQVEFIPPSPETGMPARALVSFGPEAKPPADDELHPSRHQIELWWSGEVMPEANGPLRARPVAPAPRSRWRFHELVLPYSQKEYPTL